MKTRSTRTKASTKDLAEKAERRRLSASSSISAILQNKSSSSSSNINLNSPVSSQATTPTTPENKVKHTYDSDSDLGKRVEESIPESNV